MLTCVHIKKKKFLADELFSCLYALCLQLLHCLFLVICLNMLIYMEHVWTAKTRDHASGVNDTYVVGEVPTDDIHCGSGVLIPVTSGSILNTPRSLTSDGHKIVTGDVSILTFSFYIFIYSVFYVFIFFVILYYHLIFICAVILGDKLQLVNGNTT